MPNIKSAKKRVIVNKTKAARNKSRNSALKTAIKFIFSSPFRFRRGAKGKNFFFFSCILAKSMIRLLTV